MQDINKNQSTGARKATPEEKAAMAEGRRRATETRSKVIQNLADESKPQFTFRSVVEFSRQDSVRGRDISATKLVDILAAHSGWTKPLAEAAVTSVFGNVRTTIKTIRRNPGKVETFEAMLASSSSRWSGRPEMPPNWPWYGKLASVLAEASHGEYGLEAELELLAERRRANLAKDGLPPTGVDGAPA